MAKQLNTRHWYHDNGLRGEWRGSDTCAISLDVTTPSSSRVELVASLYSFRKQDNKNMWKEPYVLHIGHFLKYFVCCLRGIAELWHHIFRWCRSSPEQQQCGDVITQHHDHWRHASSHPAPSPPSTTLVSISPPWRQCHHSTFITSSTSTISPPWWTPQSPVLSPHARVITVSESRQQLEFITQHITTAATTRSSNAR